MNLTTISRAILTMTSLEISELVESRHDVVKLSIERLAERGVLTLPPLVEVSNPGPGPKTITVYVLCKRDSYIVVAQLSPEFTARLVDRWQELEDKSKAALPDFTDPVASARAWADQVEKAQALAIERDKAVATKHLIGSRREATAMATASAAKREVARLMDKLGFSVRQATVMQVEYALGRDFDYVPMRRWCKANEVVAETVPDKRYPKGVKAWPAAAWLACYDINLVDLFSKQETT